MKYSKAWLQEYIAETLPDNEAISVMLNKKAFEVEEVVDIEDDTVFDIKVLPNRAHDALGHRGMARELCACFGYTCKEDARVKKNEVFFDATTPAPTLAISDPRLCTRFMSVSIEGIQVGESPEWMKRSLQAIGARSINNIVDVTNYVQFALNKPLHAYDARSIKGVLQARGAEQDEKLVTLDDKELLLDEHTLVIADDEKVLGLAGIKGGKYSGINADTTSIVIESANFAPSLIRKTAERYGIRTDASKRFENGLANMLCEDGLHMTIAIIKELFPEATLSQIADIYPHHDTDYHVGVSLSEINATLGSTYTDVAVEKAFTQLSFSYEKIIPLNYMKQLYPQLIGVTYKNPSSMRHDAPNAFSCSSLVSYLYKGIWMPSLSIDKYVYSEKVTKDTLRFGDIIFANTGEGKIRYESVDFLRGARVPEGMDHLAMYIGDEKVIHATRVHEKVVVESLGEFAFNRTIIGYGRIVDDLMETRYVIDVPAERLDIRLKENLIEEVGRIIGYDTLKPTLPKLPRIGLLPKRTYYENKVRALLLQLGYSEVMTYTFGDTGEVELVKGLAQDKEKLRTNLTSGIQNSLNLNLYNAPLLGQKTIKIFEFGNVFTKGKERKHLSFAFATTDKKSYTAELQAYTDVVQNIIDLLQLPMQDQGVIHNAATVGDSASKSAIFEIDFDTLLETLPEPATYEAPLFATSSLFTYKAVSPYPFITRDIAMWVPGDTSWESIQSLCDQIHNTLVTRVQLFDTFSKEVDVEGANIKKTSYAFRLIFQSFERTLTDEEVNTALEEYYTAFKNKGFEIR